MEYKDIKAGETYNVRVKVIGIAKDGVDAIYVDDDGIAGLHIGKRRVGILRPISPKNGTKNTDPAPKYDPCRKFRKGDRVELKEEVDGRKLSDFVTGLTLGKVYTVEEDEKDCTVVLSCDCGRGKYSFVHLRLVTPVEEIEPYSVTADVGKHYVCDGRGMAISLYYNNGHPNAKEAAEAECARLNAEYRKEQP